MWIPLGPCVTDVPILPRGKILTMSPLFRLAASKFLAILRYRTSPIMTAS